MSVFSHHIFSLFQNRFNVIRDWDPLTAGSNDYDYSSAVAWNVDNIALFNYNSNFDYIKTTNRSGEYVAGVAAGLSPNVLTCAGTCNRCHAAGANCYECATNNFITQSTCRANGVGRYYFSMPPTPATPRTDVQFNMFTNVFPAGTITFWIKVFGFFVEDTDMIFYGTNLKLGFEASGNTTNPNHGLNLFYDAAGTNFQYCNIRDFRLSFGQWRFFSLAYYYDVTVSAYFPPMLKFEMNQTSYPINNAITKNNLEINRFRIGRDFIGLIGSVKAYSRFIIGAYALETNTVYVSPFVSYLNPGSNGTNCINPPTEASTFTKTQICKIDYDTYFDPAFLCNLNQRYFNYATGTCLVCPNKNAAWGGGLGCSQGCVGNVSNATSLHLTSCFCYHDDNAVNSMIFRNGDDIICYRYDYINFARSQQMTITNVLTAKATQKYTLQLWIWAYNYLGNTWDGITIEWNYHNKISIELSGGSYRFRCSPFYQQGSPGFESSISGTLGFNMSQWNFVSCAVDAVTNNDFYMLTENATYSSTFAVAKPNLTAFSTTTLRITDLSSQIEWGVLFLRQIRLWNDQYITSGFLSRVEILTPSLFGALLNLYDPIYSGVNQVVDITGNSPTQTLNYHAMPSAGGTNRLGHNVVDESFYTRLFLCSENAQYYDATTKSCVNFVNLVMVNDFSFPNIPVSYKGNYSMEFWVFNEDYTDITNGVNIIYDRHVGISVMRTASNTLGASCFPQEYRNNINGLVGTLIDNEFNVALNKHRIDLTNVTGVWSWVRCAVSNYNKHFYMNDSTMQPLTAETLYDSTLNDYPFRYYFFSKETVKVTIQGIASHTKKIYLRNLYVFNDYIPQHYTFKYMNLTTMKQDAMQNLLLAVDFSQFNIGTNALNYVLFRYGLPKTFASVTTVPVVGATYALAANFVALPLCNPLLDQKYDIVTNTCVSITTCVKPVLNVDYCYDESKPLQCLNNNYYQAPDALTHICSTSCPLGTTRSPGQINNKAICNYDCLNTANCPVGSFAQISDFKNNYTCQVGYTRVNYQCVEDAKIENSAIFFSSCFNSPNVFHQFSTKTTLNITQGHILEFWFKIDNVYNSCNDGKVTGREYYFYSKPHSIFKNYADNQFYYEPTTYPPNFGVLPSIQRYEWNIIIVKVTDLSLASQTINVYVNYNFDSPEYTKANVPPASNLNLDTWSFCSDSTQGKCDALVPITWGSAYYRNVRIWNVTSSTIQLAQAFAGKLFTETLKSLINHYPLTLDLTDINSFTNTVDNYDHYRYEPRYLPGPDAQYNADQDSLYNWSTTFDWGSFNIGKYVSSMSGTVIGFGSCSTNCKRCYSANTATACYECEQGFVGINQRCVNITGYYFKTPVTTPNSPVSLRIANLPAFDITQEVAVTITFWMKFFGINRTSVSAVPPILNINSNTFLGYNISTNNLILSQNNQNVFTDTLFKNYIGTWIPITIANYKANSISYYYPNMLTLQVNRRDIPVTTGYVLPSSGITISEIKLGFEAVALFAEFRFYSKFTQSAFGQIMSTLTNRPLNMITSIALTGTSATNCISNADLAGSTVVALGTTCVGDYNIYLDPTIQCDNNENYFDPALIAVTPPCAACDNNCNTLCFNASNKQCTCDMTVGQFWLRRETGTLEAYCDRITNIDFSSYQPIEIPNLKGTITEELTIEFWGYVYVYNPNNVVFSSIDVIWDKHTRVRLFNQSNSLLVRCYSMGDIVDLTKYTEGIQLVITYFKWNLIRCGVDRRNKNYFLNSVLKTIDTVDLPEIPTTTTLKIGMLQAASFTNFGFIFLREIKLWQQFNFKYVNTGFV